MPQGFPHKADLLISGKGAPFYVLSLLQTGDVIFAKAQKTTELGIKPRPFTSLDPSGAFSAEPVYGHRMGEFCTDFV